MRPIPPQPLARHQHPQPRGVAAYLRPGIDRQDFDELLWERGPADLLALLATLQTSTEEGGKVLATERGYFRTNAGRMHYQTYRDQGLPIGSGAVESAAKHLVQQRMKRAGMRWSDLGARAILHLRCALLNAAVLDLAA